MNTTVHHPLSRRPIPFLGIAAAITVLLAVTVIGLQVADDGGPPSTQSEVGRSELTPPVLESAADEVVIGPAAGWLAPTAAERLNPAHASAINGPLAQAVVAPERMNPAHASAINGPQAQAMVTPERMNPAQASAINGPQASD